MSLHQALKVLQLKVNELRMRLNLTVDCMEIQVFRTGSKYFPFAKVFADVGLPLVVKLVLRKGLFSSL